MPRGIPNRKNDGTLTDEMSGAAPIRQAEGEDPIFDEDQPYGLVVGESDVAYVQNGHQFGKAREYLRTEPNRGVAKAFDPRKIGLVKRPKPVTVDD